MSTENVKLQKVKDEVAKGMGYSDWEILVCDEDGVINVIDWNDATDAVATKFAESEWIPVTERLPEFKQQVLCYQPDRKFIRGNDAKARVLMGYLFELKVGERNGFIDKDLLGDKGSYIGNGGSFWAFPYICHQNFVTHWMPLPSPPKPCTITE